MALTKSRILSYISDRKYRTKVNNSLSEWADIISGIYTAQISIKEASDIFKK